MTLYKDIISYFEKSIYLWVKSKYIVVPLKMWTPQNSTIANFEHPVSKSWLRLCCGLHCNIRKELLLHRWFNFITDIRDNAKNNSYPKKILKGYTVIGTKTAKQVFFITEIIEIGKKIFLPEEYLEGLHCNMNYHCWNQWFFLSQIIEIGKMNSNCTYSLNNVIYSVLYWTITRKKSVFCHSEIRKKQEKIFLQQENLEALHCNIMNHYIKTGFFITEIEIWTKRGVSLSLRLEKR